MTADEGRLLALWKSRTPGFSPSDRGDPEAAQRSHSLDGSGMCRKHLRSDYGCVK